MMNRIIVYQTFQSLLSLTEPSIVTYYTLSQAVDGSRITGEQPLHGCDLVFHSLSLVRSTTNANIGLNPHNALLV